MSRMARLVFATLALLSFEACDRGVLQPLPPAQPPAPAGYETIDLGTLGLSQLNYGFFDREGRVIAYGAAPDYRIHVYRWANGVTTDLGAPPFGSIAFSPHGLVMAGTRCSHDAGTCTFFEFRDGVITPLESDGSARETESRVVAVLDDGTAVAAVQYGDRVATVMWKNGVRIELPALDTLQTYNAPMAMNDAGQVIGQSLGGPIGSRSYFWENGVGRDLGGLCSEPRTEPSISCGSSLPSAINNHGDIVGSSSDARGLGRAVIWRNRGPVEDLGVFPGQGTTAEGINERGDIFGLGGPDHWWALIDGSLYLPGNPVGVYLTHPTRMNERGEIVGHLHFNAHSWRSFVWRKGHITDLGTGPPGSSAGEAIGINDLGEVLGLYTDQQSRQALVLWRPISHNEER